MSAHPVSDSLALPVPELAMRLPTPLAHVPHHSISSNKIRNKDAAAFLVGKPAGMYSMDDVLGISSEN